MPPLKSSSYNYHLLYSFSCLIFCQYHFVCSHLHEEKQAVVFHNTISYLWAVNNMAKMRMTVTTTSTSMLQCKHQKQTERILQWLFILAFCKQKHKLYNWLIGFRGNQRFIISHAQAKSAIYSLPWTRFIQFLALQPTSFKSILILSSHLCPGLPKCLFLSGLPTKTLYTFRIVL